jgi:hypothetical protein
MAGGLFDVPVPNLRGGAADLASDAGAVTTAGTAASGAAGDAGAGANGGPLAGACADFAQLITDQAGGIGETTAGAGTTLARNAAVYDLVDGAAASSFGAATFDSSMRGGR